MSDTRFQAINTTRFIDVDGDNTAQAMKTSGGTLVKLHIFNPNASIEYVQVFNKATTGVTPGTTVPDMIFGVPASSYSTYEVNSNLKTAISYVCADEPSGGATDPTTGLVITATYI